MSNGVRVQVPASTANLGPGFDSLGMALNLFMTIELTLADEWGFSLEGTHLEGIPADGQNLAYQVIQSFYEEIGQAAPAFHIKMTSDIPLTRGLGSSASAIVAALYAANEMTGRPLTVDELFQTATRWEGHPDNVGASLFGGWIAATWDGREANYVRFDPPPGLRAIVAIPEFALETKKARNALPQQVRMEDAVFNLGHTALLVGALATGRLDLLKKAMRDRLHQPYRQSLVPGMEKLLREATDYGAIGIALSGAGPTLIAFVDDTAQHFEQHIKLKGFLAETLFQEGISAQILEIAPCVEGVRRIY